ncbi:hypothetical protein VPH35_028402 [Triticum aestivum]|uniref:uncharacterized protein n=1 Tax=Triticum aestivum TaxID=4565 RepID=UPI001D033ACA|nr:uncharacterized protein LOC123044605 [Triticum aestivum]
MVENNDSLVVTIIPKLLSDGKLFIDELTISVWFHNEKEKIPAIVVVDDNIELAILLVKGESPRKSISLGEFAKEQKYQYDVVYAIATMAATKLHPDSTVLLNEPFGSLGIYEGHITTPNCTASTLQNSVVSESKRYFKLSCMYMDHMLTLDNIDDEEGHQSSRVLGAPVIGYDSKMIGIVCSVATSGDLKYAIHVEHMIKPIEDMCDKHSKEILHSKKIWLDWEGKLKKVYTAVQKA